MKTYTLMADNKTVTTLSAKSKLEALQLMLEYLLVKPLPSVQALELIGE